MKYKGITKENTKKIQKKILMQYKEIQTEKVNAKKYRSNAKKYRRITKNIQNEIQRNAEDITKE